MSLRYKLNAFFKALETDFLTHNRIEVSRAALLHNFDLFARLSKQQVIPVLKGNAYGHGIEQVARVLKRRSMPYIAVDGYFEALRVREVNRRQPVLVMGAIRIENFATMSFNKFTFVVQDKATIRALGERRQRIKVHLEVNTGMNRYGAEMDEVKALTKLILAHKNLELEGVMSHLADSDGTNSKTVQKAVDLFDQAVEAVLAAGGDPKIFHVAQTAGSVKAESKYANAMRLGLGLYGINPFAARQASAKKLGGLRPALKFVSTITRTHELQKGDGVSYNYTFTAPKKMRVGVIPAGYYEGVNRSLSNSGVVKVGKKYAPIVGRVCMNHTMIDLSDSEAKAGSEVIIYSTNPRDKNCIQNVAAEHKLFHYNLLTALSPDIRRVVK